MSTPDWKNLAEKAAAAQKEGRLEEALALLREAATLAPADKVVQRDFGQLLIATKRLEEARSFHEELALRFPIDLFPLIGQANTAEAEGKPMEAVAFFRRAEAISPDNWFVLRSLGQLLLEAAPPDEAFAFFSQLARRFPKEVQPITSLAALVPRTGRVDEAIDILKEVTAAAPDNKTAYYKLGQFLVEAHRVEEAHAVYAEILARFERKLATLITFAGLAKSLNRHREARDSWLEVAKLSPNNATACRELGFELIETGRLAEARTYHEDMLKRFPEELFPTVGLATVALREGRNEESLKLWSKIFKRRPLHRIAAWRVGGLLVDTGKTDEARLHYSRCVELFPKDPFPLEGLARVAQREGKTDTAELHLTECIGKFPTTVAPYIRLVEILSVSTRFGEAEKLLEKVKILSPESVEVAFAELIFEVRRGNWEGALLLSRALLERIDSAKPRFLQLALYHLQALGRLGHQAEAAVFLAGLPALPQVDALRLRLIFLRESQRWKEALDLLLEHMEVVRSNANLFHSFLEIAPRGGRYQLVLDEIKTFIRTNELTDGNRLALITALERCGKKETAVRWLSRIVSRSGPQILTGVNLMMLALWLIQKGRTKSVTRLIASVRAAPLSPRTINLKFHIPFIESLHLYIGEHHAFPARYGGAPSPAPRTMENLREAVAELEGIPEYETTLSAIDNIFAYHDSLRELVGEKRLLLNSFAHPWETYKLAGALVDRVRRRIPTSLIRLGDREGAYLPFAPEVEEYRKADQALSQMHWWGAELAPEETALLCSELEHSIRSADFIGCFEPLRSMTGLQVPVLERRHLERREMRGLFAGLQFLMREFSGERDKPTLCAGWVNFDLELWGGYEMLLSAAHRITLVSRFPEAAEKLIARFNCRIHRVIVVPAEDRLQKEKNPSAERHFPDFYTRFKSELTDVEPGELFLIGAGIAAKGYCTLVKERGGIAIDVGAMIDYWCGIRSRNTSEGARADLGRALFESQGAQRRPAARSSTPLQEAADALETHRFSLWFPEDGEDALCFFAAPRRLPDVPSQPGVTVSLTSYPARIDTVFLAVESLFRQSRPADRVVLWLAKEQFPDGKLPATLLVQEKRGLEIRWTDNFGPYKKLTPSIVAFPDDIVITADDDVVYPPDFVKDLLAEWADHPKQIVCHRAHRMALDDTGNLCAYGQWSFMVDREVGPRLFFTSGGGVLFPPGSLHADIADSSLFMALAPTADDIWYNICARLQGTPIRCTGRGLEIMRRALPDIGVEPLWRRNRFDNDTMLKNVIDHYGLTMADLGLDESPGQLRGTAGI